MRVVCIVGDVSIDMDLPRRVPNHNRVMADIKESLSIICPSVILIGIERLSVMATGCETVWNRSRSKPAYAGPLDSGPMIPPVISTAGFVSGDGFSWQVCSIALGQCFEGTGALCLPTVLFQ